MSDRMKIREPTANLIIEEPPAPDGRRELLESIRSGLTSTQKYLPSKLFFDEEGFRLFEQIAELPENYQMRTERDILRECVTGIVNMYPEPIDLIELGRGNVIVPRMLIEGFLATHGSLRYIPIDESLTLLENKYQLLLRDYIDLEVHVLACEHLKGLERITGQSSRPKLVIWLGSSIGGMDRPEAALFLGQLTTFMDPEDRLLLGVDLRKQRELLHRAYNDGHGITARFNRNMLVRLNREFGGDFDLDSFDHRAVYNEKRGAVQMFLLSRKDQSVFIRDLNMKVEFEAGESIHTENCFKYSPEEIYTTATVGGFIIERHWIDPNRWYTLNLLRV